MCINIWTVWPIHLNSVSVVVKWSSEKSSRI